MARSLLLALALSAAALGGALPVSAQSSAGFCGVGQAPHFAFGLAALKGVLGDVMGDPLECEHPNSGNGDTLQQTTTGLAMYRQSTNSPEFTDGWNHWALAADGLLAWAGDEAAPAGFEPAPVAQAPAAQAAPAPVPHAPAPPSTAYPPPNGQTPAQAPTPAPPSMPCVDVGSGACLKTAAELADAVTLLAHTKAAPPLLVAAAKGGYLVHYGDLPTDVLGLFRPNQHDVLLSTTLRDYPAIDRAPVLVHELQHVSDFIAQGVALDTTRGCLNTESNAFHTESSVWLELEGGKLQRPTNDVERELNLITQAITTDPAGFAQRLNVVYHDECTSP